MQSRSLGSVVAGMLLEPRMAQRVLCRDTVGWVKLKHLVQEIQEIGEEGVGRWDNLLQSC